MVFRRRIGRPLPPGLGAALALCGTALLGVGGAAAATPVDTAVAHVCRFPAFLVDTDPAGTNIRAGPRADAPVVARLPGRNGDIGPEVEVVGNKGAWFLIRNAAWGDYPDAVKPARLFAGPGWVAAALVGFATEDRRLRQGPALAAATVMELEGDAGGGVWGPSEVAVRRAYRCSGSFVEIDVETPDHRKAHGWATQICANQVTTCGGGLEILEEREGRLVAPKCLAEYRGTGRTDCGE
jgi:hypothetical protein